MCVYIYSYTYTCVYRYIGYVVVRKMASLSFLFTAYVPFFSHIQGRFGHGSSILEIPEMKDAQMQIRDVYWGPKNSTIYFLGQINLAFRAQQLINLEIPVLVQSLNSSNIELGWETVQVWLECCC